MAGRERNRSYLRKIFDDPEVRDAMIEGECDQCIIKTGFNVLNKCGNCQYRFKCGTDTIEIFRDRSDIIDRLGLGDVDSGTLMGMINHSYEFMEDEMGEEKIKVLMFDLIEISGMDPKEILLSLDEVFGNCPEFNEIVVQMGDDMDAK